MMIEVNHESSAMDAFDLVTGYNASLGRRST
jgi:hypothetical protein